MLTMENVTVTFKDGQDTITALNNATFTARDGEITFIVGESGSGKSTLLSAAAGLITPDSGSILIDATPVTDHTRLTRIGMIFQQANLIGALNVRDQLLITDHMRGIKPRKDRADELLTKVGLDGLGDRKMQQLSGGQRQRVGIARALMGEPSLILADEPTAALDSTRTEEIVSLLRSLVADTGVACGFVTHNRSMITDDDAVYEVRDGHVQRLSARETVLV